jgi:hypothetical protein
MRSACSSRSISSSKGALHPGIRYHGLRGSCFGSQRPPPVALQIALARRRGYASSSPNDASPSSAARTSSTVSGRTTCDARTRRDEVRLVRLGVERRERRGTGETQLGGVATPLEEREDVDDVRVAGGARTAMGLECTRSGVRGVGQPWICSQQSSQTRAVVIGDWGER